MKENKKFIMDEGGKSLDDLLYSNKHIDGIPKIDNPAKALLAGAAVAGLAAVAISKVTKKDD
ncbi:MAG: hypothetical protein IJU59_01920 [Firmicutes bacterium]|jgi:hypothetical protein|nr:hypothetical protein [Bacillota bacterium]